MGFGTIEHAFWDDADLQALQPATRLVAAYLLTCKHSTSEGYYRLPLAYAAIDLALPAPVVLGHMQAIDLQDFARYDQASQVVFIRNRMRFKPPRGSKSIEGALRKAREVPMNPYRGAFYDAARVWAPDFAEALARAGFGTSGPLDPPSSPTLFGANREIIDPAPLPDPDPAPAAPAVDDHGAMDVCRVAASLSVQRSITKGELIRSPEAVAKSRLATHVSTWLPTVERWLNDYPTVGTQHMAERLLDGGTASPYWPSLTRSAP